MTQPVVVVGAGGMGRCALDVIDAINAERPTLEVVGVVDDGQPDVALLEARGVSFLGDVSRVLDLPDEVGVVIGIGSPTARRTIDGRLSSSGRDAPTLVHPNVHRGFGVEIGPGAIICSHVSLENNIRIGRHVHVNQNSTVGHDSTIGDWTTVSPLVAWSGSITSGCEVFVGTGASLHQGITLGDGSTVGMGSVVLADVEPGSTVVGVPARVRR